MSDPSAQTAELWRSSAAAAQLGKSLRAATLSGVVAAPWWTGSRPELRPARSRWASTTAGSAWRQLSHGRAITMRAIGADADPLRQAPMEAGGTLKGTARVQPASRPPPRPRSRGRESPPQRLCGRQFRINAALDRVADIFGTYNKPVSPSRSAAYAAAAVRPDRYRSRAPRP